MAPRGGIRLAFAAGAILVGLLSTAVAGGSTVRSTVYPAGAELGLTINPTPGQVTAGNDVAFIITVVNRGADPGRHVVLTDALGPGEGFIAAVSTQGSCSHVGGTVTCALGEIPSTGRATVRVVVSTPPQMAILSNDVRVTNDTHDPNKANNHRTGYVQSVPPSRYQAAGYIPPAGGKISTGDRATTTDPSTLSVKGPHTTTGFSISVYEDATESTTYGCGQGFRCFGPLEEYYISENILTAERPALVTWRVDASQIPSGKSIDHARVFQNEAIVPRCFASATGAAPNPCVASRSVLPDGDWKLVIRTAARYADLRL